MPPSADRARVRRRLRAAAVAAALAVAALAVAGVLRGGGAQLGSIARSPESDVKAALARLDRVAGLETGAARVDLSRVALADVEVLADGRRARVLAMLDADGRASFAGQAPALAYVGREAFSVERCDAGWCPGPDAFPALRGVVAALAAAPRPAGARVLAWQIRVERETASAGEDDEVPEGGVLARRRFTWALRRDGEAWRLVPAP